MKQLLLITLCLPICALAQMTNTGQLNNQTGGIITDFSQSFTNTATGVYTGAGGAFNHAGATFTNNGTYTATAGSDNFNAATGSQAIAGTNAPVFYNAQFNNGTSGAIDITNAQGVTIANQLDLMNGITTTVKSSSATSALRFGIGSSYTGALSDTRFVDGYVTKTGATAFVYPVGAGSDVRTIAVSNLGASVTNSVAFINTNPDISNDGTGGPYSIASKQAAITSIFQGGYWDWVNLTGTANADVTVSLPDLSAFAANAADIRLIGWNTSAAQWEVISAGATGLTEGSTITGTVSNVSNYSAFGIGKGSFDIYVHAKAFLQAPYNAVTGLMSATLNTSGILQANAAVQPYSAAPFNYAGTESVGAGFFAAHNTIVDWVLVELRNGTIPATVVATRAGFIKTNGDIVDIDGSSDLGFHSLAAGSYHIAIRHRNHITIRTSAPLTAVNSDDILAYDFTTAQTQAYQNPAITTNAAMKAFSNGQFGMWGGNANSNANTRYSGLANDKDVILNTALGGVSSTVISNVYNKADVNMNGNVRYSGLSNDKDFILNTVLSGNSSLVITQH